MNIILEEEKAKNKVHSIRRATTPVYAS